VTVSPVDSEIAGMFRKRFFFAEQVLAAADNPRDALHHAHRRVL